MALHSWLENRSRGIRKFGQTDELYRRIYSGILQTQMYTLSHGPGGIYNLEFSPNG